LLKQSRCGCFDATAEKTILPASEPRHRDVAKAIADSAAGSRTEGVVRSAIAGRPLLGGRRSRRRRQADDSYPLIPSARVGASVVTSASVGLSALTLLCTVEDLAGRNLCPRRRPSSAPKLDLACVLPMFVSEPSRLAVRLRQWPAGWPRPL